METAGNLSKLITSDKNFYQKWLNTTVNIESVQTEIDPILAKVKFDLQTIKDLKSERELKIKSHLGV